VGFLESIPNKKVSLAGLVAALTFLHIPGALGEFYTQQWESQWTGPKAYTLEVSGHLFSTTSNFAADGTITPVSHLTSYQRIFGTVQGRVGLSSKLSLFGKLQWARAAYDLSTSTVSSTAFGLADQSAGLSFRAYQDDSFALDLQVQGDFPLYSNSSAQAAQLPFLGDGSMDLTSGAFLTLFLNDPGSRRWFLKGGAGFTYRTSQFSASIPWSASIGTETILGGVYASVGAHGFLSMKNDPNATTAASTRTDSNASGGSYFINAVNPSIASFRGAIGYQFTPVVGFEASTSVPIWGQAAPQGMTLGGALRFQSTPDSRSRNYSHSNRGLVTYRSAGRDSDAKIVKTNEALRQVKIDRGSTDGVENQQTWDIFLTRKDGIPGAAVARAKVIQVDSSTATLQILEYFKEVWIEEGFVARRPIE